MKQVWVPTTKEEIKQIVGIQNETLYTRLRNEGLTTEQISRTGFHLVSFREEQLWELLHSPGSIFLVYGDRSVKGGIDAEAFGFTEETTRGIVPRFYSDVILDSSSPDPRSMNHFFFRQIAKKQSANRGAVTLERSIIEEAFRRGHSCVCGEISIDPPNRAGLLLHTKVGGGRQFGRVRAGGGGEFNHATLGCFYITREMYYGRRSIK